jgi:hypothetical protein
VSGFVDKKHDKTEGWSASDKSVSGFVDRKHDKTQS